MDTNGMPLYFKDKKAGDVYVQIKENKWFIINLRRFLWLHRMK